MLRTLDEAQRAYIRAVRNLQLSDGEAYARARRENQGALEEVQRQYQQVCADAFSTYEERQAEAGGAYDDYVGAVQRAWADAQDHVATTSGSYRDATTLVWQRSSQGYQEAFADYLRSVQEAFASADPDRLSPTTLLRVAHALAATASWAAATPAGNSAAASEMGGERQVASAAK